MGQLSNEEIQQQDGARWLYRKLIKWFNVNYATRVGGTWVHPSYLPRRLLIEFGAGLTVYKQAKHRDILIVPGCTVEKLKAAIWKHLESDYEDTLNAWSNLVTQEHGLFYWTGPEIEIRKCMPTLTRFFTLLPFGEYPQLVDAPIYVVTDGEGGTEKGGDTDMDVDDEANKLAGDLGGVGLDNQDVDMEHDDEAGAVPP